MPYIARRLMKHGEGYLDDGDVIEDFEDWPQTNVRYLLEKGDVQFVEAVQAVVTETEPEPAGGAATPAASGSSSPKTTRKPAARKPTAKKNVKEG